MSELSVRVGPTSMKTAKLDETYQAINGLGLLLTHKQIDDLITAISEGKIPHVVVIDSPGPLGGRGYKTLDHEVQDVL